MANGIHLTLRTDTSAVEKGLKDLKRNLPFGISYAMNLTAKDVTPVLRKDIVKVFTIRNNWEAMGITFNAATKRNLRVEVGSRHDYMQAQVEGGESKPERSKHLAVPMVGRGLPRASQKSLTRPSKWPKAWVAKNGGAFVGEVKAKSGPKYGLWKRVWRYKVGGKLVSGRSRVKTQGGAHSIGRSNTPVRRGLQLVYAMPEKAQIKAKWPLGQQVAAAWNARWQTNCERAVKDTIKHAVESGRKKGKWHR